MNHELNEIEKSHYMSVNSTLGWIGNAAFPLCSFYASYLQQKAPSLSVKDLIEQLNIVRKLKRLGTTISYNRPNNDKEIELNLVMFCDASKGDKNGQLGIITGLVMGDVEKDKIIHPISWISHKSKRPVRSTPAAEILAAGEGVDEGKVISCALTEIISIQINTNLIVDSKDLYTSMSTQRNSIDRSIRGDVSTIRFECLTGNINRISWIPGKINLADPLTKKDSALTDTLQLCLHTGKINVCLNEMETKDFSKNNLG